MAYIKIPECSNPFEVAVNGRKYKYEAGIETEVPDEVAAIIEKHHKAHKKEAPNTVAPFGAISFNDLKDKPFYETEPKEVIVMDNVELVHSSVYPDLCYTIEVDCAYKFTEGQRVAVIVNGNKYEGVLIYAAYEFIYYFDMGAYNDRFNVACYRRTADNWGLFVHTNEAGMTSVIAYEETVKPLDTKYLPEALQFGEGEFTVVVPETTVTASMSGVRIGEHTDLIEVGTTCIVTFNGTDYECVARDLQGVVVIGNGTLFGMEGGNNEPFLIGSFPNGDVLYGEGVATISVKAKPIIKIDSKYLPDAFVVNITADGDGGWIANKQLSEVYEAWRSQSKVIFSIEPSGDIILHHTEAPAGWYCYNGGHQFYCCWDFFNGAWTNLEYLNEGVLISRGGNRVES